MSGGLFVTSARHGARLRKTEARSQYGCIWTRQCHEYFRIMGDGEKREWFYAFHP
jgi:hypothetical protein